VTPKVYKAGEVCELLQVQPYVLRSWEKEFPGIGIQKSPETPRLYRQSDVEHVQRIKQLVFGEGLTVSGARRRLEASAPAISAASKSEAAEVLDALGADVRSRIAVVRDGLRELQSLLSGAPGSSNGHAARGKTKRSVTKRSAAASRSKTVKRGAVRKTSTTTTRKQASPKRRRA
jgi:DNA-binding transcriptional MerR regulator